MEKNVRNLLVAFACLLGLAGAAAFAAYRQSHRPVSDIVVNIANESNNYFISERGVTALLTNGGKEPVLGTVPEGPRLRVLEARLKAHPFVRDAQVYRDLAGNLHADIHQNHPIARDQRIEFGPPENISEKFAKLMVFYRQIPSVLGWDTYHRVNVEYQNQIIYKIVVGLDIGTTKICALVGRKNEYGKLEIMGMGTAVSDGVQRGIVLNIDKTVEAIKRAIRQAEEQSGIDIGVVNVGIAGQHIKSLQHNGSITRPSGDNEITQDDVNRLTADMYRLVTPPGSQIIHVMPQDYKVDFEGGVTDPVGMAGVRLEGNFHIITAQSAAINNINKCVTKAGLAIENLILEPLASSVSVLSDEEKEAGAEQLKVKFGKAIAEEASDYEIVSIPGLPNRPPKEVSLKNLAYIIEARMSEIIELVYAEIYRMGLHEHLSAGIVLTGGGSQLQNLEQL
nr:hypothetical protein [Tanacetum cinerariifolium]